MRTSNPAAMERGFGGAARNVAENLARLGVDVVLCSAVGDDDDGRDLVRRLRETGCDTNGVRFVGDAKTAEYAAIIDRDGELVAGACDGGALDTITLADLEGWMPIVTHAAWLVVDCNLPPGVLASVVERRCSASWHLAVDGTSIAKVTRLPESLAAVDLLFVNEAEASALGERGARATVTSRGGRGVLLRAGNGDVTIPAQRAQAVVDVTGAGDALLAGTIHGLLEGASLEEAVRRATGLAARTVQSPTAVP